MFAIVWSSVCIVLPIAYISMRLCKSLIRLAIGRA